MFKSLLIKKDSVLLKPVIFLLLVLFSAFLLNSQNIMTKDIKIEYIFGNISFIVLFLAVLLYWFDFSDTRPTLKRLKNWCMVVANLSLTSLLIIRWWESGHFPLSNLYESLIGLSWGFTMIHLIFTLDLIQLVNRVINGSLSYKTKTLNSTTLMQKSPVEIPYLNDKIGTITAPSALLTSVFATFFLPPEMLRATALIPALKSNWLTMHVTLMVFSYAFLLVGSLLSIAYCVYRISTKFNYLPADGVLESPITSFTGFNQSHPQNFSKSLTGTNPFFKSQGAPQNKFFSKADKSDQSLKETTSPTRALKCVKNDIEYPDFSLTQNNSVEQLKIQSDICIWLNTTSYRILGLGFPLLTIGILSGAVWANEAWGSYWSWDPKETWALITWLVFAVYFHSRYNRSSDYSTVPASIASVGFIVIWVCYLGVNLLGTGLHSYGWFGLLFSLNIY